MLLVVALFGLVGGVGIPTYNILTRKDELRIAEEIVVQALRRALILSSAGVSDGAWGVALLEGQVVIYKGTSYATREAPLDEIYKIDDTLIASGVTEITFDAVSGVPNTTGSISIQNTVGDSVQILINEKGMVDF